MSDLSASHSDELWLVFTRYCLDGNPFDVEHIISSQFTQFCKDIGISSTAANTSFMQASRLNPTARVGFHEFLHALKLVADAQSVPVNDFITNTVLPKASRRIVAPLPVDRSSIIATYGQYLHSFDQLFFYYTSTRGKVEPELNFGAEPVISYSQYVNMLHDFGVVSGSSPIVSLVEAGDAFLSSSRSGPPKYHPEFKRGDRILLSLDEFREALFRCALVAHQTSKSVTPQNKLKSFLLHMFRTASQSDDFRASDAADSTSDFARQFLEIWRSEGFQDYSWTADSQQEKASSLERLLNNRANKDDLVRRNILHAELGPESLRKAGLRQRMDSLDGLLKRRASTQELMDKNILKSSIMTGRLHEAQSNLVKKQNRSQLSQLLVKRPSVNTLVEKRIMTAITEEE
eukprot:GILK01001144.1.p1 GENE.GILK01001144.1~~GILK01001144.1.p1  ORF type:complete len:410 (-),score=59.95 GILK01001144.1:183-1391(-)